MATFNIPITIHVIKGSGCATATVQGSSTYSTGILATGTTGSSYKITGSASTTATLASTFSSGYNFNNWSYYISSPTDFGWTITVPGSANGTVTIAVAGNNAGAPGTTDIYLTASANSAPPSGYAANVLTAGFYRKKNASNDHTACSYSNDFGIASCTPTSGTNGTAITYTAQANPGFTLQTWEYTNCTYTSGQGTATLKVKINGTGTCQARPVYSLAEYTATFNPNGGTWSDNTTANKTSKYQWSPISLVKDSTNYIGQFNPVVYASDGSNRLSSDPANANYYVGDLYNAFGAGTTATSANNLLNHYINNGISEGRTASNLSTTYYTNTVSRSGYTFAGWKITSVSGAGWVNGTTYTGSVNTPKYILGNNAANKYGNVTFTAQWSANNYTVNFYQGNNSTTAGSSLLGSQTITRDVATALTTYANLGGTAPSGWSFYGWSTSQTGTSRNYTNGQSVTNLASAGSSISLYAVFSKTFTFKSGVSQATSSTATQRYNPYKTTGYLTSITAPAPDMTGLSSYGWNPLGYRAGTAATTAAYAVTTTATSITPEYNVSATLYATYRRYINIYSGANKATSSSPAQYYNTNPTTSAIDVPTPTAITNWTTVGYKLGTGVITSDSQCYYTTYGSKTPAYNENLSAGLYANYSRQIIWYWNRNGATENPVYGPTYDTVYMSTDSTNLGKKWLVFPPSDTYVRAGYLFTGWAEGSTSGLVHGASVNQQVTLPAYNAGTFAVTFYAMWAEPTSDHWINIKMSDAWHPANVKIRVGSSWIEATVKRWSGSDWIIGP